MANQPAGTLSPLYFVEPKLLSVSVCIPGSDAVHRSWKDFYFTSGRMASDVQEVKLRQGLLACGLVAGEHQQCSTHGLPSCGNCSGRLRVPSDPHTLYSSAALIANLGLIAWQTPFRLTPPLRAVLTLSHRGGGGTLCPGLTSVLLPDGASCLARAEDW
jgi:hypothetical protein